METGIYNDVNTLLIEARQFRCAASATSLPNYRAKMLKTARQLEERATEIEAASFDVALD